MSGSDATVFKHHGFDVTYRPGGRRISDNLTRLPGEAAAEPSAAALMRRYSNTTGST